jgi:DNA invertase Pin-like site-specific DNA recombinase
MNGTSCAIYIRKSREDKDREAHRLEVQRRQLPEYALSRGWKPVIYDDGYASASKNNLHNLKERSRMETDIRAGRIQIVLCLEFQRLSRDDTMEDYARFIGLCRDHGVKLATPSQIIDPCQTNEWLLSVLTGTLSAAEMQVLKTRMAEGRDQARRKGKFLGGVCPPPYIYDKSMERPVIDPARLEEMKRLWKMAETESAASIAFALSMPLIAVRRAISDERLLFYQAKRYDPATGELLDCAWDPAMTPEQSERIRAARKLRSNLKKGKRESASLLTNLALVFCGYCGRSIKVWNNSRLRVDGSRLDYYGCQGKGRGGQCERSRLIPQPVIDQAIKKNILNTLARLKEIKKQIDGHGAGDSKEDIRLLDAAISQEEGKKRRLITAITDGILTMADAKEKVAEVNSRIADLNLQKTTLARAKTEIQWDLLTEASHVFSSLDHGDLRKFLQLCLKRIDVYHGHMILHYTFPRKPGDNTAKINIPPSNQGKRKI